MRVGMGAAEDVEHDCGGDDGADGILGERGHEAEDGEELGFVLGHCWAGFDGVVAGVVGTRSDFIDDERV